MQKSVTYMGFVISASGISPTEEKVEAIKQAPGPENQALRAFLGMINYHGKFIRNLSFILQTLNQLLQFKCPPGARRHSKRPRTNSHHQMYWFIMTQAFLLFLREMQASMASEQSYFTASLLVMSDLSHMPPGPWTRLRKTTVGSKRKVLRLFLGSPNFTCVSSDASSLCELITNPCWKYLLRILRLQFWLLLDCKAGPFFSLRTTTKLSSSHLLK